MSQCQCLTKQNNQCQNFGSQKPEHNPKFCWLHQNCEHTIKQKSTRQTESVAAAAENAATSTEKLTKKQSAIKISSISKKTSPVCGLPAKCLESSTIIPNIEEPDFALIQLVKCLNKEKIDENIRGVQLSILLMLVKILQENDELKTNKKNNLLLALLPEYCTAYSYWTYTDFYTNVLMKKSFDEDKERIKKILPNVTLSKTYLGKFLNSENLLNILHIVTALGRFVHWNSSYSKGNYSLIDYFNDAINYKDGQFIGKSKNKKETPPIYIKDMAYQFGCNCFCRTILMGTLLRILASNGHIGLPPENIMYVHQGGQQYCADSHILLGILIEGDPTDLSNYFYVESTYDAASDKLSENILSYVNFSLSTYKKSDTFHITSAPIDLIVISEYLNRNPLSVPVWLNYGSDLLDHEIFNNLLIKSSEITETERFGRIFKEFQMYRNSSTIWTQYKKRIESLPQLIAKLQSEIDAKVKYKGQDVKKILSQYSALKSGTDTHAIHEYYKQIIGLVQEKVS